MASSEETVNRVRWYDLDKAVGMLVDSMKNGKIFNSGWYVVFSMGTIVACNKNLLKTDTYPINRDRGEHRITDKNYATRVEELNKKTFEGQIKLDEIGKYINHAYTILYTDGYPHPGGEGSDRIIKYISDNPIIVEWPFRDPNITSLTYNDSVDNIYTIAIGMAGDLRRYDSIMPCVSYVISPEFKLYKLNTDLEGNCKIE